MQPGCGRGGGGDGGVIAAPCLLSAERCLMQTCSQSAISPLHGWRRMYDV